MKLSKITIVAIGALIGGVAASAAQNVVVADEPHGLFVAVPGNVMLMFKMGELPLSVNGPGHDGTETLMVITYPNKAKCEDALNAMQGKIGFRSFCVPVKSVLFMAPVPATKK